MSFYEKIFLIGKIQIFLYFGSLPFYIDERLYVIGCIALQEDSKLDVEEIYRLGT